MPPVVPAFRVSHRTRFRTLQAKPCDWDDCSTVDLSRLGEKLLGSLTRHE